MVLEVDDATKEHLQRLDLICEALLLVLFGANLSFQIDFALTVLQIENIFYARNKNPFPATPVRFMVGSIFLITLAVQWATKFGISAWPDIVTCLLYLTGRG